MKAKIIAPILAILVLMALFMHQSAPPAFPPVRPPHGLQVTLPPSWYSGDNAPVGITDYGVYQNVPYSYSTNEFMGNFTIYSAYFDSNSSSYPHSFSIQLNVVLNYTSGGTPRYLWVQDVAVINTATNQLTIVDNIWNITTSNAQLNRKLISGNGKVYTYKGYTYYAYQYPYAITYSYPLSVSLFVTVQLVRGYPVVNFYFVYGGKVVQYDSVTIKVPSTSASYTVEGYSLLPSGLYDDAELVTGGPGGGTSAMPLTYNATYTLQYLSSGRLVSVPHAYDYGADTAETVYKTSDAGANYAAYLGVGTEYFHNLW
ncbi:thermopsin [Thermoproteus tenax]|uniref:Thermopsin n=1 Tax=Thermoproteus tenax (strain ATCC 35583 / DSM 2078 / JCM 9277 / NBRC 100435 / Kra 1) TaxID=768679 RepID=G4RN89_THETK|nr:thermopsin [Thermoproteus tenax]CCC81033.1 thermopsin precursor [Thermoproteus tenax Kra 1]